jgi:hypothetical protein
MEEMLKKAEETYVGRRLASIRLEEAKGKAKQEKQGFERDWAGIQNEIENKKWSHIKQEAEKYKQQLEQDKKAGQPTTVIKPLRRERDIDKDKDKDKEFGRESKDMARVPSRVLVSQESRTAGYRQAQDSNEKNVAAMVKLAQQERDARHEREESFPSLETW